jgi:hypothetical protein
MPTKVIECANCHMPCGRRYSDSYTDPGYAEGIGENYVDDFGNWHCQQGCLDASLVKKREEERC